MGASTTLTVAATSATGYQWYFNNLALTNATQAQLALKNLTVAQSGNHKVVVTNSSGRVTSAVAVVTVVAPPRIVQEPSSVFANVDDPVTLQVTAVSAGNLNYQWYHCGVAVARATNNVLGFTRIPRSAMGDYRVRVQNAVATTWSQYAYVVLGSVSSEPLGWGDSSSGQLLYGSQWTNLAMASGGENHALALRGDGVLLAAGANDSGQTAVPSGLGPVAAVAAGGRHSLAVRTNGTVAAWGDNSNGQTNVPAGLSNVVAVAAGAAQSVALKGDGTLAVWGGISSEVSTVPAAATNVAAMSAAAHYTVALRRDGCAILWGTVMEGLDTLPAAATNLTAVAAGASHVLALRGDGALIAWGDNTYGQTAIPSAATNTVAIAAGSYHSLALQADGTVVVWGAGSNRQIDPWPHFGQATMPDQAPKAVAGTAGGFFSLVLKAQAPAISGLAARIGFQPGNSVVLSPVITGTRPMTYQWAKAGKDLGGETNATLNLGVVTISSSAVYSLTVSNLVGVASSGDVSLEVECRPVLTGNMIATNLTEGSSLTQRIQADGTQPITYCWYRSGQLIDTTAAGELPLENLQTNQTGLYWLVASNQFGVTQSGSAQLNVYQPVVIVRQPESSAACVIRGGALTLAVEAQGSPVIGYQWFKNGVAVNGANFNYYQLPTGQLTDGGSFYVVASNRFSSAVSDVFSVKVMDPPQLALAYTRATNNAGQSLTLTVNPTGSGPFDFKWYHDDGADAPGLQAALNGTVVASTNLAPAALADNQWHSVNVTLTATGAPAGQRVLRVTLDGVVRLCVTNDYTPQRGRMLMAARTGELATEMTVDDARLTTQPVPLGLASQWYLNGAAVRGATNATLVIPVVTSAKQGDYQVVVRNAVGEVTSQVATLTAQAPPLALAVTPSRTNAEPGSTVTLTARVAGSAPFAFQWQFNGTNLAGQNSQTLVISDVPPEAAGFYTFTVANAYGTSEVSAPAEVRVLNLPFLDSGPDDVIALPGKPAALAVSVRGAGPFSFQWMKEGQPIAGATQPAYTIASAGPQDAGQYTVAVANREGSVVSSPATLRFANLPRIVRQPADAVVPPGGSAAFTVTVESDYPVSYQWRQNGNDLPGETNQVLTVNLPLRVVAWDNQYSVVVSSDAGRVSSMNAVLTVARTPRAVANHTREVAQTIPLHPGWNAICLTVQPAANTVEEVFGPVPWTSVWTWRDREDSVQFIQDMSEAAWSEPDWLVHFNTNRVESFQNNLHRIFVHHAYLVHLDGTNSDQLVVTGTPVLDVKQWRPDAYNLTGLPLEPHRNPKAGDYFRWSPAHYDSTANQIKPIYRLESDGHWRLLTNDDVLEEGVAYWFYVRGGSTYRGPVEVSLSYGRGLAFTREVESLKLTLINRTDAARTVWLAPHPLCAGDFPLMVREVTDAGAGYAELPAYYSIALEPNSSKMVALAADRLRAPPEGFQSVMLITDDQGLNIQLPVTLEHATPAAATDGGTLPSMTGLWVGQASIEGVSETNTALAVTNRIRFTNELGQVTNAIVLTYTNKASELPTPVPGSFNHRLIFHVDTNSTVRLLHEIYQVFRQGTVTNGPDGYKVTERKGEFALVTDRLRLAEFGGVRLRDGDLVGRRMSSPTIIFDGVGSSNNFVICQGAFGPSQTLGAAFAISPANPLNPFFHRYHPDHDNLGLDFRSYHEEAYGVLREITLAFDPVSGGASPASGYNELGGQYTERIRGLHRNPIVASGRFTLRRLSTIGFLNPPAQP